MPELPDVDGFRWVLERAAGPRIEEVDVLDRGVLRDVEVDELRRALAGRAFATPRRHGKWLLGPLRLPGERHRRRDPTVVFHFGMTGSLIWAARKKGDKQEAVQPEPRHRHDRLVIVTAAGELRYRDMRKLQGVRLKSSDGEVDALLAENGPDAAEVSVDELSRRLGKRSRQIKPVLMDQSIIAGLGNLMVDEILWRARIHPSRRTQELTAGDLARLHGRMQTVVRQSTAVGRVPDRRSWLTGRRNHQDGRCPRCGAELRHTRVGGRGSTWCPVCQRS